MSRRFITANRAQSFLLPPSIDDWVEEGHLVRFIHDCVGQFDLSGFNAAYSREGGSPYDPRMMLTILLYAWCLGIRSSRKIAAACRERIDFRWAAGNIRPDHCAFARFFQRHGEAIKDLFTQVLCVCERAGAIRLGVVSLDGTKVGANASLSANRTLARLREEIERMEAEMRDQDAADEARFGAGAVGEELPDKLRRRHERLACLRLAKERLELELAAERELAASSSSEGGGSFGGASSSPCPEQGALPFGGGSDAAGGSCVEPAARPGVSVGEDASAGPALPSDEAKTEEPAETVQAAPDADGAEESPSSSLGCEAQATETESESESETETKPPEQSGEKPSAHKSRKKRKKKKDEAKARINTTDPDSRIMKGRQGFIQGYNAQAVVTREQFVVACAVTQEENDLHQLKPMLLETKRSLAAAGIAALPRKANADAGYWLQDLDIEALEHDGPELFIATYTPRTSPRRRHAAVFPRMRRRHSGCSASCQPRWAARRTSSVA